MFFYLFKCYDAVSMIRRSLLELKAVKFVQIHKVHVCNIE